MPFGDSQSKVYVSIIDGMLAVRSSESDAKAVKRELKNGTVIYERRYKTLEGKLKDVFFKSNDFGGKKWDDLVLLIFDGTDHYQLSMVFPGKYSNSVLNTIKNVDFNSTIIFSPWTKTVNDKVKAALFFNIPGQKNSVPWYFTKDTPNGLPELVPYTVPGSNDTKWSDVDRNKFYKHMIEHDIRPTLQKVWHSPVASEARREEVIEPLDTFTSSDPEAIDDLPF